MSWLEGLYCKRPIQCLASSKLLTPQPPLHPPSACVLPPHQRRWVTHSPGCEGWGVNSSEEDARYWIGLLQYNPSTQDTFLSCMECQEKICDYSILRVKLFQSTYRVFIQVENIYEYMHLFFFFFDDWLKDGECCYFLISLFLLLYL